MPRRTAENLRRDLEALYRKIALARQAYPETEHFLSPADIALLQSAADRMEERIAAIEAGVA